MKKTIAFVTCEGLPGLSDDDRLAARCLEDAGIEIKGAIWDDAGVAWEDFDAVILRSTWDYHLKPGAFLTWLEELQKTGIPLWNPPPVVRWNMEKTYLRDLAGRGVAIPRTRFLSRGEAADLPRLLEQEGMSRAVLKPTISASAWQTGRTSRQTAAIDQARLDSILGMAGVMVQEYVPEVATSGEWSLMFFGRRYSHAALKTPAAGDFRVQTELGGACDPATAPPQLVSQATAILEKVDGPLLYARVDGVERDGGLLLMELELIEPSLFLETDPGAPARFARALQERVGDGVR